MSGRTIEQIPVVVFASGRGSNFRALCEASHAGKLPVRIQALVTNVCGAGACEIAREFGIPVIEIESRGKKREAHEKEVLQALSKTTFKWILLAGYMRLFTSSFIEKFWDKEIGAAKIVNIHPSLLPSFPGTDGYGQALRYGVQWTGVTVHLVGGGLDDGPIVLQRPLEVRDDDDVSSLTKRGLELEHASYAEAIRDLISIPWKVRPGSDPQSRPRVVFDRNKL